MSIDPENVKKLNFEQFGRLLFELGVFEVLQYDKNNKRKKIFNLKSNLRQ